MNIYGLIGYPLDHSWSPAYFARKFALENFQHSVYRLFPLVSLDGFHSLLTSTPGLRGLNVTLPYKIKIIPYLTEVDELARSAGSVNTITLKYSSDSVVTKGYNTDITGFEKSLLPHLDSSFKKALILGTGGASNAVCFVLRKLGIPYQLVSRNPSSKDILSYAALNSCSLEDYLLVVNTTPAGQEPDTSNPLPVKLINEISPAHLLFDLVYNPVETEFLRAGKEKGAITVNGMEMLIYQAEESWKIWNQQSE